MIPIHQLHPWSVNYSEAAVIQKDLQKKVILCSPPKKIDLVAGVDVSQQKWSNQVFAGVVVLSFPELEFVEEAWAIGEATFSYVPGFLSFREVPTLCEAFMKLKHIPQVILCDGHGIAHPRGVGVATHLGLFLNLPTIGCAKKRLVGTYEEPGPKRWDSSALLHKGKKIGTVLRTKEKVHPMFISPGYKMNHSGSVEIVKLCTTKYRLPLPTQQAHVFTNKVRTSFLATGQDRPATHEVE